VNLTAATLAISTLLSYLLVYTPLKRKTPLCTLLGAFPGAMPTLIGWAGASPKIDKQAWFLFAVLFLWQFPHFLAIALMYREDYARAAYKMLPAFDTEGRFTRAEILVLTVILVLVTLFFGLHAGPISLATLALAGAFFLWPSFSLIVGARRNLATRVVHVSVIYLPIVLAVIAQTKNHQ
jgi:heme o synthase